MIEKPKIQYVGQFYVHGSEARKLEPKKSRKKPKTRLPLARLEKMEKLYVDPVALVSIAVAVILLAVMAVGALQIHSDWVQYNQMSSYVSQLKKENAQLSLEYRSGYDLEDVQSKASGLGLVPEADVEHISISVTVPEREPEPTWLEELIWFWKGLFA